MLFVQANPVWKQVADETTWVLGLGAHDSRIQGVVAGVPSLPRTSSRCGVARAPRRDARCRRASDSSSRTSPKGFAVEQEFVDAVRLAGTHGFVVDLCVRSQQIPEATRLVERSPEVTFVLDHLGKPDIRSGESAEWEEHIARLAKHTNVYCKLSGLTSEAHPSTGGETFRRYLRTGIEAFGPDRCMFGSDWPNASLQISYAGWVAAVSAASADLTPAERVRIMSGTARDVYARAWDAERCCRALSPMTEEASARSPTLPAPMPPMREALSSMAQFVSLQTHDIRFPTSRHLDGSDAMNPAPDYSAAYVVIATDADDGLTGHGFVFTSGRGNDVQTEAIRALSGWIVGRDVEQTLATLGDLGRELTGDPQLRWLGPEKGVAHMAVGAVINALWDLRAKREGKPLWVLLSELSSEEIVDLVDFRYLSDALTREDALAILRSAEPGRLERVERLREQRLPRLYDDSRLARVRRREAPPTVRGSGRGRVHLHQAQGRSGRGGGHPAHGHRPRRRRS